MRINSTHTPLKYAGKARAPFLSRKEKNATFFSKIQPKLAVEQAGGRHQAETHVMTDKVPQKLQRNENIAPPFFNNVNATLQTKCDTCEKEEVHRKEEGEPMGIDSSPDKELNGSVVNGNQISQGVLQASIQRMEACLDHLEDTDPTPEGWREYGGSTSVFHCGFRTILENRAPSPNDPMNECVYDHSGQLVTANHPYAGCRGTPDQYDGHGGLSMPFDTVMHTFCDTGGIVAEGVPAFVTSIRYHITTQIQNSSLDQHKKQLLLIALNSSLSLGQEYLESIMMIWRLIDEIVLTDLAELLLEFIAFLDDFNQEIAQIVGHFPMSPEIRQAISLLQGLIQQHLNFLRSEIARFISVVEQGGCSP